VSRETFLVVRYVIINTNKLVKIYSEKGEIGMNEKLSVSKTILENAKKDGEFLKIILEKYDAVWRSDPNKLAENFAEEQISLLIFGILYNQVQNGGFLQLLFNNYAPYVFGSPLSASLRHWGATETADLIETIQDRSLQVANEIKGGSLNDLSESYSEYPEFEQYDNDFYRNDGTKEIEAYVKIHISEFIIIAE